MTYITKKLAEFDEKFVVTRGVLEKKVWSTNANDVTVKAFLKQALEEQEERVRKNIIEEIKEYFGYLKNDGVTGKPMQVDQETIETDIISILAEKGE